VVLDELQHPIVLAPLAGGASTPELTAAVSEAGGLGFLAGDYLTAEALEARVVEVRDRTVAPFGVNLFVPGDADAETPGLEDYLERVALEASRHGAGLGDARYDDDGYAEKLELLAKLRPAVVSFTFGCPRKEIVRELGQNGIEVWVTVTSPAEARAPRRPARTRSSSRARKPAATAARSRTLTRSR
jgi:nitronate monooxygenase